MCWRACHHVRTLAARCPSAIKDGEALTCSTDKFESMPSRAPAGGMEASCVQLCVPTGVCCRRRVHWSLPGHTWHQRNRRLLDAQKLLAPLAACPAACSTMPSLVLLCNIAMAATCHCGCGATGHCFQGAGWRAPWMQTSAQYLWLRIDQVAQLQGPHIPHPRVSALFRSVSAIRSRNSSACASL